MYVCRCIDMYACMYACVCVCEREWFSQEQTLFPIFLLLASPSETANHLSLWFNALATAAVAKPAETQTLRATKRARHKRKESLSMKSRLLSAISATKVFFFKTPFLIAQAQSYVADLENDPADLHVPLAPLAVVKQIFTRLGDSRVKGGEIVIIISSRNVIYVMLLLFLHLDSSSSFHLNSL